MTKFIRNSHAIGKVTFSFTSLIIILSASLVAVSYFSSNRIGALQTTIDSLQNEVNSLQSQYNQLNSEYQQLKSSNPSSQSPQITNLQNQIASLQAQLSNATATIAQLRGQTGILPTFMDLGYSGPYLTGFYVLQLSLKNTGNIPITQIFVTLGSVSINMTFTYMNATIKADAPLPSYQTATGSEKVSPPIDTPNKGYPLIIQATATNGTIYTYQTTITSHA